MSQPEQAGKGPAKKLGRGLSALLGTPVSIRVEPEKPKQASPTLNIGAMPSDIGAPVTMQEAIAPEDPVPTPPYVPGRPATPIPSPKPSGSIADPRESGLREIPVEQIVPNRRQPRTDFDDDSIRALGESIRQAGLMQPIMVRPTGTGYELVAGERRWRAAKLIGLQVIPAIVRHVDDQTSAELALIENIQREDLNPMDRALALRRLALDFGLTHQAIAERVGLDRTTVSNLLRLSELDPATAEYVRRGKISQGHGKALLGVSDLRLRVELAERAVSSDWSVRELERLVQQENRPKPSADETPADPTKRVSARDANAADLERKLGEHLGTRVKLQLGRKKGSGRLILEFYTLDQFDGLMQRLGFGSAR